MRKGTLAKVPIELLSGQRAVASNICRPLYLSHIGQMLRCVENLVYVSYDWDKTRGKYLEDRKRARNNSDSKLLYRTGHRRDPGKKTADNSTDKHQESTAI